MPGILSIAFYRNIFQIVENVFLFGEKNDWGHGDHIFLGEAISAI